MSEFVIDLDHIERGIKDWQKFADSIEDAVDDGFQELYEKTDKHIDSEANNFGLSSSRLHKTKSISLSSNTFSFYYTAPHAMYIEYGTGIVGKNSKPNPEQPEGWEFNSGSTIRADGSWFYYNKETGKSGITKGQAPRPVMYNTKVWINTQATKIIRKHIRKKIERLTKK